MFDIKRPPELDPTPGERTRAEPIRGKNTGAGQGSSRDRRSVFDRIAKGKQPIPESELTPLNTTRSHVFTVMEQQNLGRAFTKMFGKREKRNANLFCAYHRDIGHETKNCNDLKKEIEHLIKQDHLKQFVRGDRGMDRRDDRREDRRDQRQEDRRDLRHHDRTQRDSRGPER